IWSRSLWNCERGRRPKHQSNPSTHVSGVEVRSIGLQGWRPGSRLGSRYSSRSGGRNRRLATTELTRSLAGAKYRVLRQPSTGTNTSPKCHWRKGHLTHQRIGSMKATDFVPVSSLPRRKDGEIDWLAVPEETRNAFWHFHKRPGSNRP